MVKFSDRIGVTTPRTVFQKDSMDDALRTRLWNLVYELLDSDKYTYSAWIEFIEPLWGHYLKLPLDDPRFRKAPASVIRGLFMAMPWYEAYNLLDYIATESSPAYARIRFKASCNKVLREEMAPYLFVNDVLTPITSAEEITAIDDAVTRTQGDPKLAGIASHLKEATSKLGKRPAPDARNAIKEAISAVEGAAQVVTGDKSATLPEALAKLAKLGIKMHPALRAGFEKLYGWTSDEKGVRHAMTEDRDDEDLVDEAKFMIPACAAFVNYLLAKASSAGRKG